MNEARRVWDVVEPIAANAYFAPEVHGTHTPPAHEPELHTCAGLQSRQPDACLAQLWIESEPMHCVAPEEH